MPETENNDNSDVLLYDLLNKLLEDHYRWQREVVKTEWVDEFFAKWEQKFKEAEQESTDAPSD